MAHRQAFRKVPYCSRWPSGAGRGCSGAQLVLGKSSMPEGCPVLDFTLAMQLWRPR